MKFLIVTHIDVDMYHSLIHALGVLTEVTWVSFKRLRQPELLARSSWHKNLNHASVSTFYIFPTPMFSYIADPSG
jgi:hypothetical protein